MKTKQITRRSIAVLMITMLMIAACTNSKENKQANSVKAPAIDLHAATFMGDLEAVQQHIQAGSDLNVKEPTAGSTPLISAAIFGKTEIALALINAGADVDLANNDGSTALHCAAFLCRTELVQSLLEHGANKELKNNYGSTALQSVEGPFNEVEGIYDEFAKNLGPLGLKLNYKRLEETRPVIANMLQ